MSEQKALEYTALEDIPKIHAQLDATFRSGKLQSIPYRKYVILQIAYMLKDNTQLIIDALDADLGKPAVETNFTEVGPSLQEAYDAYKNLDKWAGPEKPGWSLTATPMRPVIYKEGKGVCLIIGPFNYPVSMCVGPIISAIAAGNTVVFKPSESTPTMSKLYVELFAKYVEPDLVRVVNGAVAEVTKLLELPWGHIMFTGSGRVGKIVASSAGKTLTPVTLELGGKSPVFIDPGCDLETAARRILWGKTANAGQACVSPDYVVVPRAFQDTFVAALKKVHDEFYPDGPFAPKAMGKMVNEASFQRVTGLLERTNGKVAFGGQTEESSRRIAPTIVQDCTWEDSLMSEEIFGPILPIIPVDSLDDGLAYVNRNDYPLALYVFTKDQKLKDKIRTSTKSGSVVFNEIMLHVGTEGLPFGGIGSSGSGFHNGKWGFDTFTHHRASLDSPSWIDIILSLRYAPYDDAKLKRTNMFVPNFPKRPSGPPSEAEGGYTSKWFFLVLAVMFAGGLTKLRKVKE